MPGGRKPLVCVGLGTALLAWNAERHPALPRMIAAAGHEVATHGYAHRLAYEIGEAAFRAVC